MFDPDLADDREGAMTTVFPLLRERGHTRSAFLASAARREIVE